MFDLKDLNINKIFEAAEDPNSSPKILEILFTVRQENLVNWLIQNPGGCDPQVIIKWGADFYNILHYSVMENPSLPHYVKKSIKFKELLRLL
jgi:hypothetical protein